MGVLCVLKVFLACVVLVGAETHRATVGAGQGRVVTHRFLSFTVDPKYLFSSQEEYGRSQECICMAASLSPAYLRIAGPSTAHMTYQNSTITIEETDINTEANLRLNDILKEEELLEKNHRKFLGKVLGRNARHTEKGLRNTKSLLKSDHERTLNSLKKNKGHEKVKVTSDEWKRFSTWAKATGFEIVFALNNEEKSESGLWDANTALDILSVADKEGVENIFWQLGHECTNKSIDEYLNDLETLRVIVDTIPHARQRGWRVAGADVTGCLREDSRSDFKDYVALSLEMADALMLNGNSSSYELERLSPYERAKLLRLIQASPTPLWVSESPEALSELNELSDLERAAVWMASLGRAARAGADAHFWELTKRELYQPTLSFYMALLFKNLVGERVLTVDIDSPHTVLFAHCTSLRRQRVPGAVTLYGANMDDEPARLSLKFTEREEGGDIMQFILSEDEDGNIFVNGHPMSQEGDIRPIVRRVRPYKTLLINLPARSFGFWVVANTMIESCQYLEENKKKNLVEAELVEGVDVKNGNKTLRNKRSADDDDERVVNDLEVHPIREEAVHLDEYDVVKTGNFELDERIENINKYLREIHNILNNKKATPKVKRQAIDEIQGSRKLKRQLLKIRKDLIKIDEDKKPLLSYIGNLLHIARNGTRHVSNNMIRNSLKWHKNRIGQRHNTKEGHHYKHVGRRPNTSNMEQLQQTSENKRLSRTRRNVVNDNYENLHKSKKVLKKGNILEYNKTDDEESQNSIEDSRENFVISYEKEHNDKFDDLNKAASINNEIEVETNDNKKLWEVLHNIQTQLKSISKGGSHNKESINDLLKAKDFDKLLVNTEITDDGATINFKEQPNSGWVKTAFENIFFVLNDLNEHVNRLWDALSFFD